MADTATARKRLRKQSLGSNVNTWGDTKLNEVLDTIDQSMDGWLDIALTGDLTLTTTNYTTADQAKRRAHKFTGSLTGAAAVTYPSVEGWYAVWNTSGAAVTVKLSASTGVTLQNGDRALVFSNGTDFSNLAPTIFPSQDVTFAGKLRGVTAGTAATDAINKTQMETAIATAGLPATAGTVLNSASDTAAGYLDTKIEAKGAIKERVTGASSDERLQLKLAFESLVTANGTTVAANSIAPCDSSGGTFGISLPAAGAGDTALQDGDLCELVDNGGVTETNNITITGNAGNINFMGQGAAATLAWSGPNYSRLTFRWNGTTWIGTGAD